MITLVCVRKLNGLYDLRVFKRDRFLLAHHDSDKKAIKKFIKDYKGYYGALVEIKKFKEKEKDNVKKD